MPREHGLAAGSNLEHIVGRIFISGKMSGPQAHFCNLCADSRVLPWVWMLAAGFFTWSMWAGSRFFYLEYVGWQQVSTWSMWAGSRFLPWVWGLAAGFFTWSMWAGSRFFLPGVCGLAAGFYLEYVGWQQGFYLEYVGWQQVSTWSMWAGSRVST